jgi:hypothetical protein
MDAKQNSRKPFLAEFVFNRQNQMDCNYDRRNLPGFFFIHVICNGVSQSSNDLSYTKILDRPHKSVAISIFKNTIKLFSPL